MMRCLNLPVRIGLVFFPPTHPDFSMVRISLLNLINQPVFDFQDQQAVLVPEKDEIRFPALFPDGRLIPADKIRIRSGRFPKESKDFPFDWCGVLQTFDLQGAMDRVRSYLKNPLDLISNNDIISLWLRGTVKFSRLFLTIP